MKNVKFKNHFPRSVFYNQNMQEITAKLNNYRASPRKVRAAVDLIRGRKVKDALAQLNFLTKRSVLPIAKLLKSAISNAKNNFKLADENKLIVKKIFVDPGHVLKRQMPRSRGMANQILKRTSNITVVLENSYE